MGSLPSRNQTLLIAVKTHARLDITFLKFYPILLYLFRLCQIFWLGMSEQTIIGRNLAQSPSHMDFRITFATSKHFSNHDENMKQVSSVKSSKLNSFVIALSFIQGLGQNLTLENVQLSRLVVF